MLQWHADNIPACVPDHRRDGGSLLADQQDQLFCFIVSSPKTQFIKGVLLLLTAHSAIIQSVSERKHRERTGSGPRQTSPMNLGLHVFFREKRSTIGNMFRVMFAPCPREYMANI